METTYPQFHRLAGRIIRQDGPLSTWTIVLQPEAKVAMRYHTKWPSAERLAQELAGMERSTAEKFKEFVTTFYQQVASERSLVTDQILKIVS
jgi:hypothetical protein